MSSTQMDRYFQSKTAFFVFAGIIGIVGAYAVWGNDLMPKVKAESAKIEKVAEEKFEEVKAKATSKANEVSAKASEVSAKASEVSSKAKEEVSKAPAVAESSAPVVPKPHGDPQHWTDDQLRQWAKEHKIYFSGHESHSELLGMVESAMHAPDMTDPQNMGEAQLIEAAKKYNVYLTGHETKMELLGMVESAMHAPK